MWNSSENVVTVVKVCTSFSIRFGLESKRFLSVSFYVVQKALNVGLRLRIGQSEEYVEMEVIQLFFSFLLLGSMMKTTNPNDQDSFQTSNVPQLQHIPLLSKPVSLFLRKTKTLCLNTLYRG